MKDKEITLAIKSLQEQINDLNKRLYNIEKADKTELELGIVELAELIDKEA